MSILRTNELVLSSNSNTISSSSLVRLFAYSTEDNADLVYEGLGVPSLPFGHIYHPQAGLVEEVSINKKVFKDFERVLKYYIDGHGEVEYREDKPFTFPVEEI